MLSTKSCAPSLNQTDSSLSQTSLPRPRSRHATEFCCVSDSPVPTIALLGTKPDWTSLHARLSRLPALGAEPAAFAALLAPVLRRFARAFDGTPDRTFWAHAARHASWAGTGEREFLAGWLAAFCVWSPAGRWQAEDLTGVRIARRRPGSCAGPADEPVPLEPEDPGPDDKLESAKAGPVRRLASVLRRRLGTSPGRIEHEAEKEIVLPFVEEGPSASVMTRA